MDVREILCDKTFRCWECNKNCKVKDLFLTSDEEFLACLHKMFKMNAGIMLTEGYSFNDAKKSQEIITLTLYTSRIKYLQGR